MPIDLIGFVTFTVAMIGTPGPANMVVMASGARYGARRSVPFLAGVILGKQFIIWPVGLGVLSAIGSDGPVFLVLKWCAIGYIFYLAWRIAGSSLTAAPASEAPPTFWHGLIVHPLNPKAWAMVLGVMTTFVVAGFAPLTTTATVAAGFLIVQLVIQPIWMLGGVQIARLVRDRSTEVWLMRALAAAMVLSVVYALYKGGG